MTPTHSGAEIIYRVDGRDEIDYVNEEYQRFALANEGADFTREKVLEQSIWDFIGGDTTREIYAEVFRRVRTGSSIRFKFRCDSPDTRRLLQMTVSPVGSDGVEFRSQVLSVESRPFQLLLDSTRPRSSKLLLICGWCKRVCIDQEWVEVEDAVDFLGLFETTRPPMLTHGICDRCSAEMLQSLVNS